MSSIEDLIASIDAFARNNRINNPQIIDGFDILTQTDSQPIESNDKICSTDTDQIDTRDSSNYVRPKQLQTLLNYQHRQKKHRPIQVLNKQWSRLNNTQKLCLLNQFVDRLLDINTTQRNQLRYIIMTYHNDKKLNDNTSVTYDSENASIINIPLLQKELDNLGIIVNLAPFEIKTDDHNDQEVTEVATEPVSTNEPVNVPVSVPVIENVVNTISLSKPAQKIKIKVKLS